MSASFDVAVAGAGPGGIAAATVASEAGLHVCLLDNNAAAGGQIWRGASAETALRYPYGPSFLCWIERLQRTRCSIWSGWQVIDRPQANVLRIERDGACRDVRFRRLILATGARERFLPFPGWTLSGVAGAGGLQAMVKEGLDVRGRRIVIAGTGPLLLAVAAGLREAGGNILGVYEQAPLTRLIWFGAKLTRNPERLVEGLGYRRTLRGIPYHSGCWVMHAEGRGRLERVTVTNGRKQWNIDCDWLALGFHLVPNLELPQLCGCMIADGFVAVDGLQQTSVAGVACIGELTGIGGTEKALIEGQIAGWAAAGLEAKARALWPQHKRQKNFAQGLQRAFALRDELRLAPNPETLVC